MSSLGPLKSLFDVSVNDQTAMAGSVGFAENIGGRNVTVVWFLVEPDLWRRPRKAHFTMHTHGHREPKSAELALPVLVYPHSLVETVHRVSDSQKILTAIISKVHTRDHKQIFFRPVLRNSARIFFLASPQTIT